MKRRVVITGAGVVSSIGAGVDEFWRNCLSGASVVVPVPGNWGGYAKLHSCLWSPLPDIDPDSFGVSRTECLQLDRVSVNAIGAAREALENAGFDLVPAGNKARTIGISGIEPARCGVFFGTGIGGACSFLHNHANHLNANARDKVNHYINERALPEDKPLLQDVLALMTHAPRFNPFVVSMLMPNAVSASLGIKFGLVGPNATCSAACASGTVAIGYAYRAVRDNHVDMTLSGGSEYLGDNHGAIFHGFDAAGTLARDCGDPDTANRPFDRKRSGFLFSEGGAAVLVVEELEHARRRGAPIMAEISGFAETFDAFSMMSLAPDGKQIERMLRLALHDAGLDAADVDYVNAHGTGTQNNDETESQVIERVFGNSVPVNSTKSLLGHTIGASGAFEALVTALTLRDGKTHVSKNIENPLRDLNFVRRVGNFSPAVGLSQSFAFGGHNAALVLRRYDA